MNQTEVSVRDTSQAGGKSAESGRKRHVKLTDDSELERLRRDTNQRTSMVKTLDGVMGLGCFVPGQDGFDEDECKKLSVSWRHDLEMRLMWPNRSSTRGMGEW